MDARVHKRFLEYRERYGYFAKERSAPRLSYEQFAAMDAEHAALEAKGELRDDEDETRYAEVTILLFRD